MRRALRNAGLLLLLGAAAPASAAEISAFIALGRPSDRWAAGAGGAFTTVWFDVLALEAEGARIPGEIEGRSIWTLTGDALLAPTVGRFVPYGGLGVGLYLLNVDSERDSGTLRALVLGVKFKLAVGFHVKAEWRKIALSGEPGLDLDQRFSFGAGISF